MRKAFRLWIVAVCVVLVTVGLLWLMMADAREEPVTLPDPPTRSSDDTIVIDARGKAVADVMMSLKNEYGANVLTEKIWHIRDNSIYAPWYIIHNLHLTPDSDVESKGILEDNGTTIYHEYHLEQWYFDLVGYRPLRLKQVTYLEKPERELFGPTVGQVRTERLRVDGRNAYVVIGKCIAAPDFHQPHVYEVVAVLRHSSVPTRCETLWHALGFNSEQDAIREMRKIISLSAEFLNHDQAIEKR